MLTKIIYCFIGTHRKDFMRSFRMRIKLNMYLHYLAWLRFKMKFFQKSLPKSDLKYLEELPKIIKDL